jgi:hypothetical protein
MPSGVGVIYNPLEPDVLNVTTDVAVPADDKLTLEGLADVEVYALVGETELARFTVPEKPLML